jgi:hypothetical protein
MAVAGSGSVVFGPSGVGPLRSLLERFRRGAGVPASVGGELAAELAPVFAALDEIEREVDDLREQSQAAVADRLRETEDEIRRIVQDGRRRAIQERDEALTSAWREADAEAVAVARAAKAEGDEVRRRGAERMPALVAEVLARVLEAAP